MGTTPATEAAPSANTSPKGKRMFAVLGIGVAIAILAFIFLPWGTLFVVTELSEAALLFAWAVFDIAKYLHDRSDETHLRDGVFLVALALLTIAVLVVGLMREAPWKLSSRQQAKIAETVAPLKGETVSLVWLTPNTDSDRFAHDLKTALESGGVKLQLANIAQFDGVTEGMTLTLPDANRERLTDVFTQVFRVAGQKFVLRPERTTTAEITVLQKPH